MASPMGRYLLEWELRQCDQWVADIFGYNALQIGLPECNYLRQSRIVSHIHCAVSLPAGVLGRPYALPFASASLDLVVLPHVLEFTSHPHQVLREVERVLVPEGVVLIAGFNPFSLWGVRRLMSRRRGEVPWCGHFFSARRLRDWLMLLSLECDDTLYGCYRPAGSRESCFGSGQGIERVGRRVWPMCGGAYLLRAVKRVHGMHLLTPAWRNAARTKTRLVSVPGGSRNTAPQRRHDGAAE